jgi:ribonuclease D
MRKIDRPSFYVETTQDLEHLCTLLEHEPVICLDTEFMRTTTYYAKLCLIQIATPQDLAIIDPLGAHIDLTPLWALWRNPNITWVIHSARQDLEVLDQAGGGFPVNLFDTQVTAMLCGLGDTMGYDRLILSLLGENLDKSAQRSNWLHRPLKKEQLEYCLWDVYDLPTVYDRLHSHLDQHDRLTWLQGEMADLLDLKTYVYDLKKAFNRLFFGKRTPEMTEAMMALLHAREHVAQEQDLPRGHVLADDVLKILAKKTWQTWDQFVTLVPTIPQERARQLYDLWEKALPEYQGMDIHAPEKSPSSDKLDSLELLLGMASQNHGISPTLIASRSDLVSLIIHKEDSPSPILKGWRSQVFGQDALQFLRGEKTFKMQDGELILVSKSS